VVVMAALLRRSSCDTASEDGVVVRLRVFISAICEVFLGNVAAGVFAQVFIYILSRCCRCERSAGQRLMHYHQVLARVCEIPGA